MARPKSKVRAQANRPDLSSEDRARLVWLAGQLGCGPGELMTLGLTWMIRHLQGMVTQGVFTTSDVQKWRADYPTVAYRAHTDTRTIANDPGLSLRLARKYAGTAEMYESAAAELATLFHMPKECIPRWILRQALWGGFPPGDLRGYP